MESKTRFRNSDSGHAREKRGRGLIVMQEIHDIIVIVQLVVPFILADYNK